MQGLVSFLNVKPTLVPGEDNPTLRPTVREDAVPTVRQEAQPLNYQPKRISGPTVYSDTSPTGVLDSLPTAGLDSSPTVSSDSKPTVVGESAPTVGLAIAATVGRVVTQHFKLSPLQTAKDGHSSLENRLYEALWESGEFEIVELGYRCREITIGYQKAGQLAKTDKQNAKKAIESLITKLSIERIGLFDSCARIGSRYRIFSDSAVIARRRAVGYTAVIRNRGGVQLWAVGQESEYTVGELSSSRAANSNRLK
jgi:hypothetical protein